MSGASAGTAAAADRRRASGAISGAGTFGLRPPNRCQPCPRDASMSRRRHATTMAAPMLTNSLVVAAGGALGSVARFWLAELFAAFGMSAYPWATLIANVSGSLLIGLIAALTGADGRLLVTPELRLFWMVGVCGGYTTFSSFSQQTLTLAQGGEWARAAANICLSVILCLVAVWVGYMIGAWMNRLQGA